MKKVVGLMLVVFMVALVACQQAPKIKLRTDTQPIQNRFVNLSGIEKVYWVTNLDDDHGRVLPIVLDYHITGFAFLSEETVSEMREDYAWEEFDFTIKGIDFEFGEDVQNIKGEVAELNLDSKWSINEDFTEYLLPEFMYGTVLVDFENKLMYYHIYTM
jgi:hypothetical protein